MRMKTFVVLAVLLFCLNAFADDDTPLQNWQVPFESMQRASASTGHLHIAANSLPSAPSHFIAMVPCRVFDTRLPNGPFGGPTMSASEIRTVAMPSGPCSGIPSNAASYSVAITIRSPLTDGRLTAWPTGSAQPSVATVNYTANGRVTNAAIVPAGTNGSIDVFVSAQTDVILDINGYFVEGVVTNLTPGTGLTGGGTGNVTIGLAPGGVGAAQLAANSVTSGAIASGQVVKSLNNATDAVTIQGSGGTSVSTSGGTITISTANGATLGANNFNGDQNVTGSVIATNAVSALQYKLGGGRFLYDDNFTLSLGRDSGASSTGYNNVFIGNQAGLSNTDATDNTLVGTSAGASGTAGFNSFFGSLAGLHNTSGKNNVAVGANAGSNLTTGDNNIDIANSGFGGEAGTIRIGSPGVQTRVFMAGIWNAATPSGGSPVLIDVNGQMGTNGAPPPTSMSIPNAIVQRDSSQNFAAGIITATLNGTATNFSGNLGGEVTGSQSSTTVANAVSTNAANAIVRRDASGKFSAGSITATSLGIGTTPTALLHVIGTQPPPVGGPGTNATDVLTIHGGKGGDSTALGARAGMGGGVVIQGGDGGTASTVAFSSSIGGAGGSITLQPGEEGVGAVYGPPGMVLLAPTSYYPTVGVGTNDPLSALDVRGGDVMVGLTSYPEAGLRSNSVFVANDNGDVHNQYRLDGNADTLYLIARSGTGSTHGTSITFRTGTAGTGENDRVTIDSNGLLSIAQLGGAGSTALCRNASNQIATCSSSIRYKENVNAFGGGLDVVRRLRPVTFRWKDGGTQDLGLIAEEVNKVEPLLTVYNAQGKVEGVKYDHLTVVLINAVEQLERENDSLRARLDRLEHVQK